MKVTQIQEILESIGKDILTDDIKEKIAGLFNEAVETSVNSKVQLVVENELQKLDDEHTAKLEKLLEAIDTDHTKKIKTVVEQLDANYAQKLMKVATKYEKELKEGAESLNKDLTDKISSYLDLYLAESVPQDQLKEAVENTKARKMINQIKQIVAVDEEFVNENVKEAIKDGHNTIETLRAELNKTIKESATLKQDLIKAQSQLLLEKKTQDLSKNKKAYVYKLMEGKKPEEIEENFKFVLEMYEKDESDKIDRHAETVKKTNKTILEKIDVPKFKEIVEDDANGDEENTAHYLKSLKDDEF